MAAFSVITFIALYICYILLKILIFAQGGYTGHSLLENEDQTPTQISPYGQRSEFLVQLQVLICR